MIIAELEKSVVQRRPDVTRDPGEARFYELFPNSVGIAKGWAEMIRKVYEVDPLVCPQCGGQMKVIAFLTDFSVVDRIIGHLKLSFVAERPPPPHIAYHELLMAPEAPAEYLA